MTCASLPSEEESINKNDDAVLKKGCLNDAELLIDKSALRASHSSSMPGDTQKEALDGDETSLRLKMEVKPKPSCSGDCGKIARDEDEDEDVHPHKIPSSVDEGERADEVGIHAIEDNKKEQGRAVESLLDMHNDTIKEEICLCLRSRSKSYSREDPFDWTEYKPQQQSELYQRLALYRIRGYDNEFTVERKLAELDDATLAKLYPPPILYNENYFENYEESLEWYFDPELCKYAGFDDYQRLVLRSYEYRDWDSCKSNLHTYEKDLEYVKYCEAIENETKWVDDYLANRLIPWERVKNVAYLQSLKVAEGFPNLSPRLVSSAFHERIWSIVSDFTSYKGLDVVFFEIWKRVAKRKMDFTEALSEVYRENLFPPSRRLVIEREIENPPSRWSMKDKYYHYVACIGDLVSEDQALPLITESLKKMSPNSKNYVDYAKKKMKIAREIGLIREGRVVYRPCPVEDGEGKLEMDN